MQYVENYIGPCYNTVVVKRDFGHSQCLKIIASKGVSLGIIAGGGIVKIPQIASIAAHKSGEGVNALSYVLDSLSLALTIAYSFHSALPVNTFAENIALLAQNGVILLLKIAYDAKADDKIFLSCGLVALSVGSYLLLSATHLFPLAGMAVLSLVLSVGSKIPQIKSNFDARSTGQLSLIGVGLSFVGCLARVGTSVVETSNLFLIATFALNALLNLVLLLQILGYSDTKSAAKTDSLPQGLTEKHGEKIPVVVPVPKTRKVSSNKRYVRKLD